MFLAFFAEVLKTQNWNLLFRPFLVELQTVVRYILL